MSIRYSYRTLPDNRKQQIRVNCNITRSPVPSRPPVDAVDREIAHEHERDEIDTGPASQGSPPLRVKEAARCYKLSPVRSSWALTFHSGQGGVKASRGWVLSH